MSPPCRCAWLKYFLRLWSSESDHLKFFAYTAAFHTTNFTFLYGLDGLSGREMPASSGAPVWRNVCSSLKVTRRQQESQAHSRVPVTRHWTTRILPCIIVRLEQWIINLEKWTSVSYASVSPLVCLLAGLSFVSQLQCLPEALLFSWK